MECPTFACLDHTHPNDSDKIFLWVSLALSTSRKFALLISSPTYLDIIPCLLNNAPNSVSAQNIHRGLVIHAFDHSLFR